MKVAVIYNRESTKVINLFGIPNREKYGLQSIQRILNSLKKGGHQAVAIEGDKDLIDRLEEFMPRVIKGELPGMALNLSYGIQGQARYTHVPGILEMVGLPYVGSNPLAHSLALDKVVAKMLFVQNGVPTPEFAVIPTPDSPLPDLEFPLIVKPKNEAVSFGIQVVDNMEDLKKAALAIFNEFGQAVLVEQYIEGREINVGLLGNGSNVETFLPAELIFGDTGPNIYTLEDKKRTSGREVGVQCPADLDDKTTRNAQDIAKRAFEVLGCYDCARVDMRLDKNGNLYILEINSLPSLGAHGSYVAAAEAMGINFTALINRLIQTASSRYFGTPEPPSLQTQKPEAKDVLFGFLTRNRDLIEKKIESWVNISSRTDDPAGIRVAAQKLDKTLKEIGMKPVADYTDHRDIWTWESPKGFRQGTLFISQLDVPRGLNSGYEYFRRTPEWLFGEGIGSSRAQLVQFEFMLRAMKSVRRFSRTRVGFACYADEGRHCDESAAILTQAAASASQVVVLKPGNIGDFMIVSRRGQQQYRLIVDGKSVKLGQSGRYTDIMKTLYMKLLEISKLNNKKARTGISAVDFKTEAFPERLPHRVQVLIQASYPTAAKGRELHSALKRILKGDGLKWNLIAISERPPMREREVNLQLINTIQDIAEQWGIPLNTESSLWPSAAGMVPDPVPVVCGLGPVAKDLYTSREAVSRISIVQRTLMMAQFLLNTVEE
jgi:D-alanine-D-alanine ligase